MVVYWNFIIGGGGGHTEQQERLRLHHGGGERDGGGGGGAELVIGFYVLSTAKGHPRTNSFKSECTFQNCSHLATPFQVNPQNRKQIAYILTQHQTNFRRPSPFSITPDKRAHNARTCWYRWLLRLIFPYQVKEKYEYIKRMNRNKKWKKVRKMDH